MHKDSKNNGLNSEDVNSSVAPLGDDSVESLTIAPSPSLLKTSHNNDEAALDADNADADADGEYVVDDHEFTDFDDGLTETEDLSDVRVANMTDDMEVIETDFQIPDDEYDEDGNFIPVKDSDQLSSDQHLIAILRANSSLTLDNKAARKRTAFLIGCMAALSLLLAILIFAFTLYPKTVYIPTKDNTAICEVLPQDNPLLTDITISEFGRDGILSLYSINFTNWQEQTDRVFDQYFTSDGKIRTIQALKESGLIAYVDNNALSLRANSTKTSHVESKGFFPNGTPYWTVSFPFVVEVYSGREKEPIQIRQYVATARVVVDRASASNPKGLGIDAVTLFESKK